MRKKIFSLFIVILFYTSGFAQRISSINEDTKYKDSLIFIVKTTKNDSIKSSLSFELVGLFKKDNEIKKMDEYLKIGNKYAVNYPYLRDCSGYFNAMKFLNTDDIDSFANEISKTLKKIEKYNFYGSYKLQTLILQNLSLYHQIKGDKEESMRLLIDEAIPVTIKVGNKIMLANLYKMIATNMVSISDREKADDYFKKSIEELESLKSPDPFLLETIIDVNIATGENLLNFGKLSEGRKHLDKAFSILKKYPNSNLNILYYIAEGNYYTKLKQFNKALNHFEKGIAEISKSEDFDIIELNNLKLGKYESLFELKRYSEAKTILTDLIENGNLTSDTKNDYLLKLSTTLEKLGDYKNAYFYSKQYIKTNDSIVTANSREEVLSLEAKFNKSENEKKINDLESEKLQAQLKARNNKLYYISLGGFSILLLLIIFLLWKNTKTQKYLAKEKEINYLQNLKLLNDQKEIEVMQAMILGEEAERKRIARDLHDGIGSRLSAIKMKLQQTFKLENNTNEAQNFSDLLSNSIDELKQISYNLMPETLLKLGLEFALKDLCLTLSTEKTSIRFHANGIHKQIAETHQIAIFRIVQELVNNALKHGFCSEIVVDCNQNEKLFLLTVEDNGIGFNTHDLDKHSGLGLKNIKNRIDLLDGKLELKTGRGKGTIYNIELLVQI
jgi:two-component system, NarL family, sensor kinase